MESLRDYRVTTGGTPGSPDTPPPAKPLLRAPKARADGKPAATVRFGSVAVPVYQCTDRGRCRFILSYHRDGRRMRQSFMKLEDAKKEALLVAQRIQTGMQTMTDLRPQDREAYLTATRLLAGIDVPLVVAVDDYVRARTITGATSLASVAAEHSRYLGDVVERATVPEVVALLIKSRGQDGAGGRHLASMRTVLNRFAAACPGPILDVTSAQVDDWLRGLNVSASSRNTMLRYVNLLFAFALERNHLPEGRATAPAQLRMVRTVASDVRVFTPAQMRAILHAAPPHLVPLLAVGAFSGIRMAELARLDWIAIDLDRRIIEIRAGQAKTASRRVIPVTDNLAAWLAPLPRRGRVLASGEFIKEATSLARALGIEWPRNVLRHSFISYRIAIVKSADQVALEAGNSPAIIFRHYRELTTEPVAAEWFSILPKDGQWENGRGYEFNRASRTVTLGGTPE